jgi:hypothetical protein
MGVWYSEIEPPRLGLVNLRAPSHSSAAGLLHLDAECPLWAVRRHRCDDRAEAANIFPRGISLINSGNSRGANGELQSLPARPDGSYSGFMLKAWHIIAETWPAGGKSDAPPFREYFVVAMPRSDQAVQTLRMLKNLYEAKLTVVGEATPDFVEKSKIKDGDILSVGEFS